MKKFDIANKCIAIPLQPDGRPSWHSTFFAIAEIAALRSKDPHTQVGACLVKDGRVIGIGYNGEPRNFQGSFDWNSSEKYDYVVHAEMNAITNACSIGVSCVGAEIYVTLSPCHDCMKLLVQHKIKSVYYKRRYKDFELAKKIADSCGVQLIELL